MKKVVVISLGGSLIVPEGKMNIALLEKFKHVLRKHYSKYKFVIVCGGGYIARKYISVLRSENRSKDELSHTGILATRMNALFIMQLFEK